MNTQMKEALARHSALAFSRMRQGATLVRKFHSLPRAIMNDHHVRRIYQWLVVPFSLWPVDVIGLAGHLFRMVESGQQPSREIQMLAELIGDAPKTKTCDSISSHEHSVKGGNYESLIKAQHKFDDKEELLKQNPDFLADWKCIKTRFEVSKYQAANGVIRRRMVSERSFRPPDWDFTWKSKDDRFLNIFDAFCYKWVLYGMEKDRPLLQKLSVNVTPHGTMIFIPRYWSFDCSRDLRWRAITRLHHCRGVPRQGRKLGANQRQRRKQAQEASKFWAQATGAGMRGGARERWVVAKLGMHPDTDRKQLRRLLKAA
jgi:hypothetical protein